jgi:hypothetical protein
VERPVLHQSSQDRSVRHNAKRVYGGFRKTTPEMIRLGYEAAEEILNTPIDDAAGVATWVDSIFNSCVPLPALRHIGQLPKAGGRHHYPAPITDIELVKYDDFVLWVTDPESNTPAAVVPVAPRGAGVSQVQVAWATPGTALHRTAPPARAAPGSGQSTRGGAGGLPHPTSVRQATVTTKSNNRD